MTVKTTLLALLLTGSGLWAQTPPGPADNADTNRDEILRRALRQAIDAKTNLATAKPVPLAAPSVPLTEPEALASQVVPADPAAVATNRIAVPSNPAAVQTDSTNQVAVPSNTAAVQTDSTNQVAVPSTPAAVHATP